MPSFNTVCAFLWLSSIPRKTLSFNGILCHPIPSYAILCHGMCIHYSTLGRGGGLRGHGGGSVDQDGGSGGGGGEAGQG
jgi:hypothetical protein